MLHTGYIWERENHKVNKSHVSIGTFLAISQGARLYMLGSSQPFVSLTPSHTKEESWENKSVWLRDIKLGNLDLWTVNSEHFLRYCSNRLNVNMSPRCQRVNFNLSAIFSVNIWAKHVDQGAIFLLGLTLGLNFRANIFADWCLI